MYKEKDIKIMQKLTKFYEILCKFTQIYADYESFRWVCNLMQVYA